MLFTILTISILFLAAVAYYFFYLAPKLDPSNRAQDFIKSRRFKDAIVEYKKILDEKPFDFVTHYRLANLYLKLNDNDQAAIHLQRVLDIEKFNYEVDKFDVERKLAVISVDRDDVENTFKLYYEILKMYPNDRDALYHVAFISLGQEEFDIAQRYFDRLAKGSEGDFEIMFGAGICSYQNQKFNEAVDCFKNAIMARPDSDIGNLAYTLALIKKRDFRNALIYSNRLIGLSIDLQVKFVAMRCSAFIETYLKKYEESVKRFEELLEFTKKNEMQDEMMLTLYDIGFACQKAEYTKRGYDYWNDLSSLQRGYNDVQELIMTFRREMENNPQEERSAGTGETIVEKTEDWLSTPFHNDFLWGICNLKNDKGFNIRDIIGSAKVIVDGDAEYSDMSYSKDLLEKFGSLDTENFRIVANRVVNKIGYKVDQIMTTYRESDGVDFMATKKDTKEKTFVWVRRWKKTRVGEIPLRNFAQQVNDLKANIGLFVTTSDLTEEAQGRVKNLSKVKIIMPEELNGYLQGLL
jgi:tetratricopeptide (TPR) repeat protein